MRMGLFGLMIVCFLSVVDFDSNAARLFEEFSVGGS